MEKAELFTGRIMPFCDRAGTRPALRVALRQLVRSGTSIGANISEAQSAESRADFVHKLSIALKEARETSYWLRTLKTDVSVDQSVRDGLYDDCVELIRLLVAIIKTMKDSDEKGGASNILNS